jgi:hypothetical protein
MRDVIADTNLRFSGKRLPAGFVVPAQPVERAASPSDVSCVLIGSSLVSRIDRLRVVLEPAVGSLFPPVAALRGTLACPNGLRGLPKGSLKAIINRAPVVPG